MKAEPVKKTKPIQKSNGLAQVQKIIAIASGKGGVGKSTTAVMIAHRLAASGAKVGILDADVYGPSVPIMTGVGSPTQMDGDLVVPPVCDGVAIISPSMFAKEDKAQIMRGPMAGNLIKQLLSSVRWGALDYLLVDFPPGTGDIQLTIAQSCTMAGAVIVTTPQDISLADVRKAVDMFATLKVPVIGVVENMSYFVCDSCEKNHHIFGENGGKRLAESFGLPLLAKVPLDAACVKECDNGRTNQLARDSSPVGKAYGHASERMVSELAIMAQSEKRGLGSFHLAWQH